MNLNNDDGAKFPIFKKYLMSDFPQLASNTKILDGLTKWGLFGQAEDAKRRIMFGSNPRIATSPTKGTGFSQFNDFPTSVFVPINMVQAFEDKEKLEGNAKFENEMVFFTTGNGHRIFQIGLKLLELLIQGNLLISKDTTVVPDDSVKALSVIKDRVTAFEKEVYGGVNTSVGKFF